MTSLHCLLAISGAPIESVASVTASVEDDEVAHDMPEDILAMIRSQTSWTATHGSASVMFMEVKGGVDAATEEAETKMWAWYQEWSRIARATVDVPACPHDALSLRASESAAQGQFANAPA